MMVSSILRPPVLGGDKGFFFDDHKNMIEMINAKKYPIKIKSNFWQREKLRIKEMDSFVSYNCETLSILLDFEINIEGDSIYLKKLSDVINAKYKKLKKKNKDLDYYIATYIGEVIRKRNDAEWKLLPKYAFEVYYIPEIVKDSTFCPHWGFVFNQIEMISFIPLDIETLIEDYGKFYPFTNNRYVND
jgi:hypothetical protein